ncbi:MAG: hypothetical protein AB1758_25295 [Candidatus Eremiobacterota bacterium]
MDQQPLKKKAFSLTELLLAVGLLALVLLTLIAMTTSAIRSNQKAVLLGPANQLAESLMSRTLYEVENDIPPGTRDNFWNYAGATPWKTNPVPPPKIGDTAYEWAIYAQTVTDTSGAPLGGPDNRVKKVDIVIWWWDSKSTGGTRKGYGRMELQASRLVNEVAPPAP